MRGYEGAGILAGKMSGGTISSCYTTGFVAGRSYGIGGLVGNAGANNSSARIVASYSAAHVRALSYGDNSLAHHAGGLIGWLFSTWENGHQSSVIASYATGSVTLELVPGYNPSDFPKSFGGGLIGRVHNARVFDLQASYATGKVTATGPSGKWYQTGPLVGHFRITSDANAESTTVTDSYWDTETTGVADNTAIRGNGKATADLRTPTAASGIYANWDNLTIDDAGTNNDNPWHFGASLQYPILTFGYDAAGQARQRNLQDATLHALSANTGTLSPTVEAAVLAYNLEVGRSRTAITLNATPTQTGATWMMTTASAKM